MRNETHDYEVLSVRLYVRKFDLKYYSTHSDEIWYWLTVLKLSSEINSIRISQSYLAWETWW